MSTNCFISKKMDNGKYKYIYCHWDGYPEYVGEMLKKNYTDPKKVDRLIALGDISSLGKIIGHKHGFNTRGVKSTTAYHRDRGEPWEQVKPKIANSKQELINTGMEYIYFYENNKWSWVEN
jgi:hypothetical protein